MGESHNRIEAARLAELTERLCALPISGPAEEARRDHLVDLIGHALLRHDGGMPLVVAVAGPSGVGKSHLVNRVAGIPVSREGVVRPTTTVPVVVSGDQGPPAALLERLEASDPDVPTATGAPGRLDGVTLVDLPATSHTESTAALADLVLLVVSPARYADAAVWDTLTDLTAAGVPLWLVTNRMAPELTEDLRRRLDAGGIEVRSFVLGGSDGTTAPGGDSLAEALSSAAADTAWREQALGERLGLAAAGVAALADDLEVSGAESARLLAIATANYDKVRNGVEEAVTANPGAAWSASAERLVAQLTHRVGTAAGETAEEWSRAGGAAGALEGDGAGLWRHDPATDVRLAEAMQDWHATSEERVAEALRRRPSPPRLARLATLVRDRALGGGGAVPWLVRRRFRRGIDTTVLEVRESLVDGITAVVDDDGRRFAAALGPAPSAEELDALRAVASTLVSGGEVPTDA